MVVESNTVQSPSGILAARLEWGIPKVKFYLRKLRIEGKLSRRGNNRSGKWVVSA
ncbi:MAG: hypothetical protein PUI29_09670 [Aeromonadales bacterium]|nr:hypothetical protein [Aeromonadales bacterium]MDY2890673.1 hypothetical protein [Succinivibrio sp.]